MIISDVPTDVQLEIIDLKCDSNLREGSASDGLKIAMYLFPGYLKVIDLDGKILCMFGTT